MKPSIPKGTRDFLPSQVAKRRYIFDVIRQEFENYAYQPIETPVMENLSTLTGKYGEEGDQLLFKVLNNGDYLKNADNKALESRDSKGLTSSIAKRGLRYDLTVPFARFVTMHQNDLAFPFKRYQIQQVWRGDRPQKGRYQEFYQCDADVVGSESLMYEAELIKIFDNVYHKLGLSVTIKLNNRKILFGIAESLGIQDHFIPMTVALDKLDKIGEDAVVQEMVNRGIQDNIAAAAISFLSVKNLDELKSKFVNTETGQKGIQELEQVFSFLNETKLHNSIIFDISLARGLSYYTGCIFEVAANGVEMGSIGGGGRYDDLTSSFGLDNVSGVGISFGAERIYDVMEELKLFPESVDRWIQLLIIAFDEKSHLHAFKILSQLRESGISADLYPEPAKMKKQMKYADRIQVPFVLLIGENEMNSGNYTFKNMSTGEQSSVNFQEIFNLLA